MFDKQAGDIALYDVNVCLFLCMFLGICVCVYVNVFIISHRMTLMLLQSPFLLHSFSLAHMTMPKSRSNQKRRPPPTSTFRHYSRQSNREIRYRINTDAQRITMQ